jgi:hypothetical protein
MPSPHEELNLRPMAIKSGSEALLEDRSDARVLLHHFGDFLNARCS